MLQIDAFSYMKKNMDYYLSDFYQSPQFGSITTKMISLFFDAEGYFDKNKDSFPRNSRLGKISSKQMLVLDFFSPDGDFFKQLLLHHQTQYYTQAIGLQQHQKNTFFNVLEAKSVYLQSLLGNFIDKLAQCQNYCQFSIVHNEYYKNPSNLYLMLIERYLQPNILNEILKQTFGQGNFATNFVLSSTRSLNKAHVVIPIRTLPEFIRTKILIAAHVNVQKTDYTECICDQIQATQLERQAYMQLERTFGLKENIHTLQLPECRIKSIRSGQLLVTQLVLKNLDEKDPLRDLAAFFILIECFTSKHIYKTLVLFNLLVTVNMCGDSLILFANQEIINQMIERLLIQLKDICKKSHYAQTESQNYVQELKNMIMNKELQKPDQANTLLTLVGDQLIYFLNQRLKFTQSVYKKGITPFLNQNIENFSNYTQMLRILLKNNKIGDIEHLKVKQNLDLVANSYQSLQSAILSLITKSLDYNENYILANKTQDLIQQILNNCDYTVRDIISSIYGEDKAEKLGNEYHKKKLKKIILFNVIETSYERLNELFGVKTKEEMIDMQLETIKYYENLEKSGIDFKIKDWKDESEDIFVIKQILKSKQFIKIVSYFILFLYLFKHVLIWLMH